MNIYLINALLVLLVVRQIREHQLDLRALAVPVLAVGAAAVMFLHSVPGGGSDIALDLLCLPAGAALGTVGGLATHLRADADGLPLGRAASWPRACGSPAWRPDGLLLRRDPRGRPGHRRLQRRAPHHRPRRLDRRAGHDGAGRRDRPAGRRIPPRPPATPAPRSSRHLPRLAPAPELASGPHSPTVPDRAPPTAAPCSCDLTARSVPGRTEQKRWACQRPGSPRPGP